MFSGGKMCYTCLKAENKELVDLYKNDIDKIPYVDKLAICIAKKLQMTASMELCWPCIKQLRVSYRFIDMVNGTQESLRSCIEQTDALKDEPSAYATPEHSEQRIEDLPDDKSDFVKNEISCTNYNSDSSDYFLADLRNDNMTDDIYSCKKCSKVYVTSSDFTDHLCETNDHDESIVKSEETEVSDVATKVKCEDSKEQKTTKKVRNRPSKYIKKPKPEIDCACEHCELTFNKRWKLQKHLARVHIQDKKYVCTYCNRGFKQSYHLREHITSHTGERNYSCTICDKTFQRISSQRRHIRTHDAAPGQKTKRTPFLCTICGKSFPFSNGVQRHMRIHLGIKSHECHLCKRRFTQSTHLHVHMRTHTGEKPYICDTCGEAFSLNASLQKHMTVHQSRAKNFVEDFTRVFLVQESR